MMTNGGRWSEEHTQRLCELWRTDKSQTAIAKELGFSAAYINAQAEAFGLPPRTAHSGEEEVACLFREAKKRNVTPRMLRERVLSVVLTDHLIGAVLDDEGMRTKENADAS